MKNIVSIVLLLAMTGGTTVKAMDDSPKIPERLLSILTTATTESHTDLAHLQKHAFSGSENSTNAITLLMLRYAYECTQLSPGSYGKQAPYFTYWYCFWKEAISGKPFDNEVILDAADELYRSGKEKVQKAAHEVLVLHGVDTTLRVKTPCNLHARRIVAPRSSHSSPAIL